MEFCNVTLALAGNKDHTVTKYRISAPEIKILLAIHGDSAVSDIEIVEESSVNLKQEKQRLFEKYAQALNEDGEPIIAKLYAGRSEIEEAVAELELPEEFFKPTMRALPKQNSMQKTKKVRTRSVVESDETDEVVSLSFDRDLDMD
jgi:hypothetical protein